MPHNKTPPWMRLLLKKTVVPDLCFCFVAGTPTPLPHPQAHCNPALRSTFLFAMGLEVQDSPSPSRTPDDSDSDAGSAPGDFGNNEEDDPFMPSTHGPGLHVCGESVDGQDTVLGGVCPDDHHLSTTLGVGHA